MADPIFIQQAVGPNPVSAGDTSEALAYTTLNLTAGSTLVAFTTWGTSDGTPTCADPTNGSWTAGVKLWDATNGQGFGFFYKANNTSTAKPTVTVSYGGTKTWQGLHISEIGPADTTQPDAASPAWRTQNLPANTANLVASNAVVPVTDNALIYGATADDNGIAVATAGSGFNSRASWTGGVPARVEDTTLVSHASTTATFTAGANGTTRANTGVIAIRPSASGPATNAAHPGITLQAMKRGAYF